jgi:hypothetical protein
MKLELDMMVQKRLFITLALTAFLLLAMTPSVLSAQTDVKSGSVQAVPPYVVSVFTQSVPGQYTQPDSLAFNEDGVYIGYGDGNKPDGSDGKSSQVVQYDYNANVLRVLQVKGHNDGLKVNPATSELWSIQNEDGNARLVIFNTKTWTSRQYILGTGQHGGGYDDIVFRNGRTYVSASNPQNNPNDKPAIVEFRESNGTFTLTPVLMGNASATDLLTGAPVLLNLQDPDSMIMNLGGDIVLDSQADGELIVVHDVGTRDQTAYRLPITVNGQMTTVDDTDFPNFGTGYLLMADRDGETVYKITKPYFSAGSPLSASDTSGFVGELDFGSGILRPVVSGFVSPHGMAFIPTGLTVDALVSGK